MTTTIEILEAIRSVPGWLSEVDVALFIALADMTKNDLSINGFVEIGAYQGKSSIALGFLLRDEEPFVVVDPFERLSDQAAVRSEQDIYYRDLTRETFERNYLRAHGTLPTIIHAFSTELVGSDLPPHPRIIHIDGAHDLDTVRHDVTLALDAAGDRTLLVFDDFANGNTPGVTAAVWEAVKAGRMVPLALTNKLYVCLPEAADAYRERLGQLLRSTDWTNSTESIMEGLSVWHPRIGVPTNTERSLRSRAFNLLLPPLVPVIWRRIGYRRAIRNG